MLAVGLCVGLLATGSARAAEARPAWHLAVTSQPTNLVSGATGRQGFLVVATNVGAADTEGDITLVDHLPAGLFPAAQEEGCDAIGRRVSCTFGGVVHPGESLVRFISVTVSGASGALLTNVAAVLGGGVGGVEATVETEVGASPPPFNFLAGPSGLAGVSSSSGGAPATRAGSSPYEFVVSLGFPTEMVGSTLSSVGHPRNVSVDLPPGFSLDPAAVPRCRAPQLAQEACPPASQVGLIGLGTVLGSISYENVPLYNMVPPPGSASNFGFLFGPGVAVHLLGSVRVGEYGLSARAADLLARTPILSMQLQFWGNPADPSHDAVRGSPVEARPQPLITLPSVCGPLEFTIRADSWEAPGSFVSRSVPVEGPAGGPLAVDGCTGLSFEPTISVKPTTAAADSSGGAEVTVGVPRHVEPEGSTTSTLRGATVTLPVGMGINPSVVDGQAVCTPAQVGLVSQVGEPRARFDGAPATCPDASKLGTVEAETPLLRDESEEGVQLPHPLTGLIYLAQPSQNPFGSLFALYAVIEDPETGIVVKLAGKVTADPLTGQLTASFDEIPQLPFEEFKLDFFGGARGVLRTPALCGSYVSRAAMTPWSGTAPVRGESRFSVSAAPSGGTCATVPDRLPAAPRFDAGSVSSSAGRYAPFVLGLYRDDGSQELGALEVTLPDGLVGRLAGSSECADAALAAAAAKSGGEEAASPSCPAAARLGRVVAKLGAGSSPYPTEGRVYLAGPYRGAPLSLAIIAPAVAGPFDLGTIVVRAAVFVDSRTGRLTIKSDRLPRILDGVPLDIRSLQIELDKPNLIRNPTSCEPMAITGSATTTLGQVTPLSVRFQVGDCAALAFGLKLSLRFSGALGRNGHPALRAVLRANPEGAALESARFTLPAGELLDLRHVRGLCPLAVAARDCPPASRLGSLRLQSPSLDAPLTGPVYLRAPRHRLPGLVAEARSGNLHFVLRGRTTLTKRHLGIALQSLPDIPLSRAVLTLAGGRRGILVNSHSLCRRTGRVTAHLAAHNGRHRRLRVRPRRPAGCSATRKRKHHS